VTLGGVVLYRPARWVWREIERELGQGWLRRSKQRRLGAGSLASQW